MQKLGGKNAFEAMREEVLGPLLKLTEQDDRVMLTMFAITLDCLSEDYSCEEVVDMVERFFRRRPPCTLVVNR